MKKRSIIIILLVAAMLVVICRAYCTNIISRDEETGNIIVKYNLFSDYTYEIYDDYIKLLVYKETNKKTVKIPDTIMGKPVTEIGTCCFSIFGWENGEVTGKYLKREFETVTLGKNISKIGEAAFEGCESLTEVLGDNLLLQVGDGAFGSCSNLVYFEPRLQEVSDYMFSHCYSLEEINEESDIISIGRNAFSVCSKLKSIGDQPNLLYVGDNAFGLSGLEEFTVYEQTEFGEGVFDYTPYAENLAEQTP